MRNWNHQQMVNWLSLKQFMLGFEKSVWKPFSPRHSRKANRVWGALRRAWEARTQALRTPKDRLSSNDDPTQSAQSDNVLFSVFGCDEIELVTDCQWHIWTWFSNRSIGRHSHITMSQMTWKLEKSSCKLPGKTIIKTHLDYKQIVVEIRYFRVVYPSHGM